MLPVSEPMGGDVSFYCCRLVQRVSCLCLLAGRLRVAPLAVSFQTGFQQLSLETRDFGGRCYEPGR